MMMKNEDTWKGMDIPHPPPTYCLTPDNWRKEEEKENKGERVKWRVRNKEKKNPWKLFSDPKQKSSESCDPESQSCVQKSKPKEVQSKDSIPKKSIPEKIQSKWSNPKKSNPSSPIQKSPKEDEVLIQKSWWGL